MAKSDKNSEIKRLESISQKQGDALSAFTQYLDRTDPEGRNKKLWAINHQAAQAFFFSKKTLGEVRREAEKESIIERMLKQRKTRSQGRRR